MLQMLFCRLLIWHGIVMQAFAGIADSTRDDVYLHPHVRYYVREVRVVAYSQVRAICIHTHTHTHTAFITP